MLYARVALLALLPLAAAQDCSSLPDAGTLACSCNGFPCADISSLGVTSPVITTTVGDVTGIQKDGFNLYVGVPVGASTAGANRWTAPKKASITGTYAALKEKVCPVSGSPMAGLEDCITVDVYSPVGASMLPLAFYIHGGGFTAENPYFNMLPTNMMNLWPASNYANLPNGGKAVAAFAHYRLGALGWMAHPGFIDSTTSPYMEGFTGTNPGTGNYGMMDVLFEIKFMQDNAAVFGIDGTKVSVFGESAGAAHVCMLMASPMAESLGIKTYIAESPYISIGQATFSMQARMDMGMLWTIRSGCASSGVAPAIGSATATSQAACLRAASILLLIPDTGLSGTASKPALDTWEATYGAQTAMFFTYNSIHSWPCVDGYALVAPPLTSMAAGTNKDATMVLGHNSDEYGTFCYGPDGTGTAPFPAAMFWAFGCENAPDPFNEAYILGLHYLAADSGAAQQIAAFQGAMSSAKYTTGYMEFYSTFVDEEVKAIQMGTDAWFAAACMQMTEALLGAPGRPVDTVFQFVFAQDTDPWATKMGACHGCELTYILGYYKVGMSFLTSLLPPSLGIADAPTAGSILVGNAMTYYWSALFHKATPNVGGSGYPTWAALTQTDKQMMVFNEGFATGALMNPCVRATPCKTEPTKDWRYAAKMMWVGPHAMKKIPEEKCTSAPMGMPTHPEIAPYNCSYLPCCVYNSAKRSLLFGMPSAPAMGSCDPMC